MAFCEQCGCPTPSGATECPTCGAKVYYSDDVSTVQGTAPVGGMSSPGYYPTSRSIPVSTPRSNSNSFGNLKLADGEQIVRSYRCCTIVSPRCDGTLGVTNKRVVFYGSSLTGANRIDKEVVLDSVSGIDAFYGLNVLLLLMLLGIAAIIYSCVLLRESAIGLIPMAVGVLMVLLSLRRTFYLSVYSSKANGTPIDLDGITGIFRQKAYTLVCRPSTDTDRMINELGAIVLDLQALGDHAIEKWSH